MKRAVSQNQLLAWAAGLLVLASLPSLATAASRLDGHGDAQRLPHGFADWVQFGAALTASLLLAAMVTTRTVGHEGATRRRLLTQRTAVAACTLSWLYTTTPASSPLARHLGTAVYGVVLAWLAIEVCRASGARLSSGFDIADRDQRLRTWGITSWFYLLCVAGSFLVTMSEQLLRTAGFDNALIVGLDQRSTLGLVGPAEGVLAFIATVAIEDVVIVAATATLLAKARRPTWHIYTAICLVEVAVHAYMGISALAFAVLTASRIWLYRRYQGFLPLAVAHLVFNISVLLKWFAPGLPTMVIALMLATAAILGVAPRRAGKTGATA
ncbi:MULTISPECIES: hypothetical protein [Streptomyces]|uniref:CPBP family intramembrane metalloprotease n=5 Tax=Streptomyces TaxID=1883 RepID=A0ABW9IDH4_STRGJ|nr:MULTISPECIES: hypothetical protein [Streptomyces]MBP5908106.1 hypothetical protein [Streptomyces sp. LBUM 1478]MBP5928911.1 hypothetical protein [Streptomyces sp. LBUM 1479]KFG02949.1 hypothetical protein IQ61_43645 [Streptomyces scabiei]MBD9702105.1 hypothetical protein [Streptomyces caniscabiei]MBD9722732.1 hypothetical protein [Streptomyces caniscabiei]